MLFPRPLERNGIKLALALLILGPLQGCGLEGLRFPSTQAVPETAKDAPAAQGERPPSLPEAEVYERLLSVLKEHGDGADGLEKARRELEKHIQSNPDDGSLASAVLLKTLLGTALELEKEREAAAANAEADSAALEARQKQLAGLKEEARVSRARIRELEAENEELKAIVEQLRDLELDMEQKRRQLR